MRSWRKNGARGRIISSSTSIPRNWRGSPKGTTRTSWSFPSAACCRSARRAPPTKCSPARGRISAARSFSASPDNRVAKRSEKRLDPRLRAAEDQRVDVVGTLVGVDRLEIAQHAHDVEFLGNAVAAVHVAGEAGGLQRLSAIFSLWQPGPPRRSLPRLRQ